MNGGFDRTGEFRKCIQLFHQRVSTGRLQLKYRTNVQTQKFSQEISAIVSDFVRDCCEMSKDLKSTRSKLVKLGILLKDPSSSSEKLNQLIDIIQHDILDLNRTKTELNTCLTRINTASLLNPQFVKHIRLIITGLEYHLSNLVSNFRNLLDNNKNLLSLKSQEVNETHVEKPNQIVTHSEQFDVRTNPHEQQSEKSIFYVDSSASLKSLPKTGHGTLNQYTNDNPMATSQSSTRTPNALLYPPIPNGTMKLPNSAGLRNQSVPSSKTRIKAADMYTPHLPSEDRIPRHDQVQLFAEPVQAPFVDQEVRQRDAAMRRVESTIVQLGEIYEQFSTLVREQGDMVMRIDSNIDNAELNIDAAHTQFLELMRRVSANRAFIIKKSPNSVLINTQMDSPVEMSGLVQLPTKRYYRQRAHCNPWSIHTLDYPLKPSEMDWKQLFDSSATKDQQVRFVDIGCGYGGLLFALSTQFSDVRSLGLEIRLKVSDFVQDKIRALRINHPGQYGNIACLRTNAMKFLPNYFNKGQLHKLFFLYPDPHFKRVKHKWRIISPTLLDIYAYLLCPGGKLYSATDVPDLAKWISDCLLNHPLFKPVYYVELKPRPDTGSGTSQPEELFDLSSDCSILEDKSLLLSDHSQFASQAAQDPILNLLKQGCTDESHKANREGRGTTIMVFERLPNPVELCK